jgi:hypothetical protein
VVALAAEDLLGGVEQLGAAEGLVPLAALLAPPGHVLGRRLGHAGASPCLSIA